MQVRGRDIEDRMPRVLEQSRGLMFMVGRIVLRRTVPIQIMRMTMRQIGGDGIERPGMGARTMRGGDDERSDQQGGSNHQGPDGPDNPCPPMISCRLHLLLPRFSSPFPVRSPVRITLSDPGLQAAGNTWAALRCRYGGDTYILSRGIG